MNAPYRLDIVSDSAKVREFILRRKLKLRCELEEVIETLFHPDSKTNKLTDNVKYLLQAIIVSPEQMDVIGKVVIQAVSLQLIPPPLEVVWLLLMEFEQQRLPFDWVMIPTTFTTPINGKDTKFFPIIFSTGALSGRSLPIDFNRLPPRGAFVYLER